VRLTGGLLAAIAGELTKWHLCESRAELMAVNAERALQKEQEDTTSAMTKRLGVEHGGGDTVGEVIGIAFSGGGVRAASFSCGLLRGLAEKQMLKQVSCISAVSGGTYASTAFASHVLKAESPRQGQSIDNFYKTVVENLEGRMRRNIGYLIRTRKTWTEFFTCDTDGSGRFPPCFDGIIFLLRIVGSLILSPLLLMLYIVMPISIFINVKNGLLLQGIFCDPTLPDSVAPIIRSFLADLGRFFWKVAVGTIVASFTTSVLWECKPAEQDDASATSASRRRCCQWTFLYLTCRSIRQFLVRLSVFMLIYFAAVSIVMLTQLYSWGFADTRSYVRQACHCYILNSLPLDPNVTAALAGQYCHIHPSQTERGWNDAGEAQREESSLSVSSFLHRPGIHSGVEPTMFSSLWSEALSENRIASRTCEAEGYARSLSGLFSKTYMNPEWAQEEFTAPFEPRSQEYRGTFFLFVQINAILFLGSVFLMAWDSVILRVFLASLAPLWATYLTASFARWEIFGPITTQYLFFGRLLKYTKVDVAIVYSISCAAIIVSLPFYNYLHSSLHIYYRKSLHQAYYADGQDIPLKDVSPSKNPYCPALVLGACVNDYGRPSDTTFHEDFSFTPWFSGGARTGFWETRVGMSKAMSVSGAALDAAMLMKADKVSVRFLMSLLSLQMGDWVNIHNGTEEDFVQGKCRGLLGSCFAVFVGLFHFFITLCYFTWKFDLRTPCNPKSWIETAGVLAGIMMGSAFIAHWPVFDCLMRSPLVQKIQITLQHHFQSKRVPDYLYLSDGGLIECLGLLGLLRRNHRWMIVTDATATKDDPTFCLRQTISLAKEEKICSFFDPEAPDRCLDFKLDEFKDVNRSQPFMHLRVRYENVNSKNKYGDVYFVRMRNVPAQPFDVEEDLAGQVRVAACYPSCAPCCGCCGTFPDIHNANQFITPEMFEELCKLGCRLSSRALQDMQERMEFERRELQSPERGSLGAPSDECA